MVGMLSAYSRASSLDGTVAHRLPGCFPQGASKFCSLRRYAVCLMQVPRVEVISGEDRQKKQQESLLSALLSDSGSVLNSEWRFLNR